uniref:Thiaminase-2/PQQC domain-containing protein n=1 Tax=Tetraselmis chuii TaxID=63592 RepID=A0A7S1X350_9CHLO|mmetsp:Transcript_2389/g.4236  ORF Transcript_2389/g.4236 Transcript_2389/m.4236 type:complete len:227 (+) Transcript_2389:308-988(+)
MADILEKLRAADFNTVTTAALEGHPFISDAEAGNLSSARLMAFVKEQHSVIRADLLSMRHLAKRCRDSGKKAGEALFTKLAKGEELAMTKLQDFATHLGVTPKKLATYNCQMEAQAYPSYLARCAHYGSPAAVAVACAVNFPCWGAQCRRLHTALLTINGSHGPCVAEDVAFLDFFATPLDGLDEMAAACLQEDDEVRVDDVTTAVRLLQACEVMFWDSVYYKHRG